MKLHPASAVALGAHRSARKARSSRANGQKGGRPPLRFVVVSVPGRDDADPPAWFVLDRHGTPPLHRASAPTYRAARLICRQLNQSNTNQERNQQ